MNPIDVFRGMYGIFTLIVVLIAWPGMLFVAKTAHIPRRKMLLLRVTVAAWVLVFGGLWLMIAIDQSARTSNGLFGWLGRGLAPHIGQAVMSKKLNVAMQHYGWPMVLGSMAFMWAALNAMFVVLPYGLLYKGSIEQQASRQGFFAGLVTAVRKFWPQKENTGNVALGRFRDTGGAVYLGFDRTMHTHIVGATGVGKTEAIKKIIENDIRADIPVVWIDGKGDLGNAAWFAAQVARYGKEHRTRFFLPSRKFGSYNAFRYGNATELTDRLVSSLDWSEQYYKNAAKDFLLGVFRALQSKKDREFTLADVYEATNNAKALQRLIAESEDPQAKSILASYASNKDKQHVLHGLAAQLSVLVNSSFGEMLLGGANDIDFREVYEKSMFVYIAMPVTSAEEFFPSVGKMMIADLNALNSAIAGGQLKRYASMFSVVIDEFSSFVTPQFVKLLSQARSQNFAITIAHQTFADLAKLDIETQSAIMGNTNIKLALQLDVPSDAELVSNMLGTRKTLEQTYQTESGMLGEGFSGRGSMKVVDEYVIHPNEIKRLGIGQAAFIRKRPLSYGIVDINEAWKPASKEAADETLDKQIEYDRPRDGALKGWSLRPAAAPRPKGEAVAQQPALEKKPQVAFKAATQKAYVSPAADDDEAPRARPAAKSAQEPVMRAKKPGQDDDTEW